MKKTFEIRCSNKRVKGAREITCHRYLGSIDEQHVRLICPRCGRQYLIVLHEEGGYQAVKLRDEKLLASKPKE